MKQKLLTFLMLTSAVLSVHAQCGPAYSDNSNFDSAGNSIGISFTTDASCGGTFTSFTFNSGFSVQPSGPDDTIGYATVPLYEGDGLAGNVLGTLNNVVLNNNDTFDFSALMIPTNASSKYTIIVSDFTLPILTGRGFNGPFFPPYTGGVLYRNGVVQTGEHLAFSVSIDNSTLSTTDVETNTVKLRVYPNPAINKIQLTSLKQQENYIIFDVFGKKVLTGIAQENQAINIQQLHKGIYFLQLENNVLKFIKN